MADWQPWARLGLAATGAVLLGPLGFVAGAFLGGVLFPDEFDGGEMPPIDDYLIQSSAIGAPIPIVLGTVRIAGNIIWMGESQSYQIAHSSGGGGKGGGGDETTSYETKYRRSFLISICEGPAYINRAWKGKDEINVADFTTFDGDSNSGIGTLIGEDYAEYSNLCLAYFEDYELGNSPAIPNFLFEVSSADTPETSGKIHIYTLEQLQAMEDDLTADYELMNNIDATATSGWNGGAGWAPVGADITPFSGNFDGRGFTISNLFINRPATDRCGLFGYANNDLTDVNIENVRLTNINYNVGAWSGALVGTADGGAGGYVIITRCFSSGEMECGAQSGGLIGGDAGPLKVNCFKSMSSVNLTAHAGNRLTYSGGFSGSGGENFEDCYATGNINLSVPDNLWCGGFSGINAATTTFRRCYSSGSVPNKDRNGGFLGDHSGIGTPPTFVDCYWDITSSGRPKGCGEPIGLEDHAGLTGKTTGQMMQRATYANWDFTTPIWKITEGVTRAYQDFIPIGIGDVHDMNFALMIKELLLNERHGNYEESDLITEDFESIITYCGANDLRGSLAITSQRPLSDWIAYICSHFQGYFYEFGGKVGLNCYRDQASVLSISQDDLVRDGDTPPIHTTKRDYSATFNRLEVTWTNRTNNYKTAVVPSFDRIDQREAGQIRIKTLDLRAITNKELAGKMAWLVFIDQMYRFSTYTFKLGYKSMLLEVGDVIDVTDGHLLVAQRMRVMKMDEEKDGRSTLITAVEDISEHYPAIEYETQETAVTPDPPITLADGSIAFREDHITNKLHLSITPGGAQCNGFYIYKSYDDITYSLVGKAAIGGVTSGNANSTGTIQSNLPAYPAVVHRSQDAFVVDIGTVTDLSTAISDADFFNNRKLARIGNEIIAYKNCVETPSEGVWDVSSLIRGLFGTEAVAHIPAEAFNTLDIDFTYTLLETDVGKTIYFKVVSYYAKQSQLIADVTGQSVVISGKYLKPLPVSLMRIDGREGLLTYKTVDVVLDWYFCSKVSGYGRGGYGTILWGAYSEDPLLERLKVELKEQDGTSILIGEYVLANYAEPTQLEILEADRNGKNPVRVNMTPGSHLSGDETRSILIEKI